MTENRVRGKLRGHSGCAEQWGQGVQALEFGNSFLGFFFVELRCIICSLRLEAGILFVVSSIPAFKKLLLEEHLSVLIKCV